MEKEGKALKQQGSGISMDPQAQNPPQKPSQDAARLKALSEAYFGLAWVIPANVLALIGVDAFLNDFLGSHFELEYGGIAIVGCFLFLGLCVFLSSCGLLKKLAFGVGWPTGWGFVAALIMAFTSWICIGIFGLVGIMNFAYRRMRKAGIRTGSLGFRKRDVAEFIERLNAA